MLCYMMSENYDKACGCATEIIENANMAYGNKIWVVRGVLFTLLGRKEEAELDFQAAKVNDAEAKAFLEEKKRITIEVFPEENRLCQHFPHVTFKSKLFPDMVAFNLTP